MHRKFALTWAVLLKANFLLGMLAVLDWTRKGKPSLAFSLAFFASAAAASMASFVLSRSRMLRMQTWTLPVLVLVGVWFGVVVPAKDHRFEDKVVAHLPAPTANAPNVLLVIVDTLRADHLSTYGYSRPTSPNLTAIANKGVLFENAIAASSWTLPSHVSILSGLYPHEHRAVNDDSHMEFDYPVIEEAFQASGYRTAAFSGNKFVFCGARSPAGSAGSKTTSSPGAACSPKPSTAAQSKASCITLAFRAT